MKCPYCGAEMKRGFISQDRYSLKWIPEEKYKGGLFQWFSKGIKLTFYVISIQF
ncbi:PF20097 family protein [Clostridium peptidivorans]|uniref:PF20097 family protein n=1 Tax=Clostridium peptidivorans TaxID=100174 RepID=UPI0015CED3F4|nr:PF20097 family protein [Clostridium peptidivorans]